MKRVRSAWPLVGVLALATGCIDFHQAGKDLSKGLFDGIGEAKEDSATGVMRGVGRGLMQGVNEQVPATGKGVMKGVGDGLRNDVLTDATNEKLLTTINTAGDGANQQLVKLTRVLDALLATLGHRGEQVSRGVMRGVGDGLGNDVLGQANQDKLNELLFRLTGTARDQLTGQQSHDQLVAIVRDALAEATLAIEKTRAGVNQDLKDAEARFRNALIGIGILVVIAGAVIAYLIWLHSRNQRLVHLLTGQIDRIPDQKAYDELVRRIRDFASASGLEPHLRKQLKKQGLLKGA